MAIKAISAIFLGALAFSGSTCGKSTEDPTKEKPTPDTPIVELPGVDIGSLTTREKKEWSSYVGELMSPCPNVPVPVAQCVKEKRDCDKCAFAAKYAVKLVKDGMTREQVEKAYKNRFDPSMIKNVPIDNSPTKGPESAPLTVVEFADFQCPHCGEFAPQMDRILEQRKNDIRFVYKIYVLGKFPNSENAGKAAFAAGKQGKFWEMHHLIFANQQNLDQAGLDGMATQLGLNIPRFHADMQSPEATERLTKDRKLGEELKIEGTPSIFVNGRMYDGHEELNEWLNQELAMMGKGSTSTTSAPAPSSSSSAKPPSSAPAAPSASAPKK